MDVLRCVYTTQCFPQRKYPKNYFTSKIDDIFMLLEQKCTHYTKKKTMFLPNKPTIDTRCRQSSFWISLINHWKYTGSSILLWFLQYTFLQLPRRACIPNKSHSKFWLMHVNCQFNIIQRKIQCYFSCTISPLSLLRSRCRYLLTPLCAHISRRRLFTEINRLCHRHIFACAPTLTYTGTPVVVPLCCAWCLGSMAFIFIFQ